MTTASSFADGWPATRARLIGFALHLLARALPAPLAAGKGLLTGIERRLVLAWLKPIEALVRMLIIMSASVLPESASPPDGDEAREPGDSGDSGDLGDFGDSGGGLPTVPGFRLVAAPSGSAGGGAATDAEARFSAWVLVERLDAALAALENPEPHVARLARRLGRHHPDPAQRRPTKDRGGEGEDARGVGELAYPFLIAEARTLIALAAAPDTS